MSRFESGFASMSTKDFVAHLEAHGITPTTEELSSLPVKGERVLESGIEASLFASPGQRFGESVSDAPAK